jgi:hypothetical protein
MKKILCIITVSLITLCWFHTVFAQASLSSNTNLLIKIVDARKANAALMHQYTWNSRTELFINGEVKDNRLELVNYGFGNQLTHSLLNDQSAPLPRGFLRRAIAENEKAEVQQYLTGLRGLLDQYTLPTAGKILDLIMQAQISGPDQNGSITLTGNNVVVPGDSLSISVDAFSHHVRMMRINTLFQANSVGVHATFNTISSGLSYMAFAEVTIPAKAMMLQVMNFNYQRPN